MKQFESFRLDTANECLWENGVQITLPPKQFAVLRFLVDHPGRLVSHDELLDAVWPDTYVQPQVLRTYVLELRKILCDDARQPRFIQSLPKRGYRFIASVTESSGTHTASGTDSNSTLIGRQAEIDQLHQLFGRTSELHRQVVFITGDPGIGKTALVDAFCQSLDSRSAAIVVRGQCVQGFGRKEQYYPVIEALSQIRGNLNTSPGSPIAPPSAPPDQELSELCRSIEELAASKPLVLIFEDLHWADDSTIHLISALARRRTPAHLLLIATCTAQCSSADHPLKRMKHDLLLHHLATEIALAPLRRSHLTSLIQRSLDQPDLPDDLAGFIHLHSEGNPLFAIAILKHLIEQKFLVRNHAEGSWQQRSPLHSAEAGVPDELTQMIELEIEQLDPPEQRLLEAGSLFEVAFPAWAIAAALDQPIDAAEEACEALVRRTHYVRRAGQDELPDGSSSCFYVFAHGLYRQVLYQRQPAARRAQNHLRVAQRLGELFAGREDTVCREIALHYEASGNRQQAIATLRCAAQTSLETQAHRTAEDLLENALSIAENLPSHERRVIIAELRRDLEEIRAAFTLAAH